MTNILMHLRLCVCVWGGYVKKKICRLHDRNGMIY